MFLWNNVNAMACWVYCKVGKTRLLGRLLDKKGEFIMRSLVIVALCATIALVCAGCGGGGGTSSSRLQLFVTDAPVDAEAINVVISSIEVHSDSGGWVTVKQYTPPLTINLMDFQAKFEFDGDPSTLPSFLLMDAPLAVGHYTMVRLHVDSVEVVVAGQPYSVDISNVAQTGIKLNHEFDVAPGGAVALLLDFNGKKSVIETGNGVYKLQPVIAMVPKEISGTIKGVMAFKDAGGLAVPVPPGATVEVFQSGTTTLAGSGQISETDGTFAVGALLPGTYDLKVNATGHSADTVRLGAVTLGPAETKDVGEVVVPLP